MNLATMPADGEPHESNPPPRPANQKIADWIFTSLKDDIILGRIRANEILVEGAVADRFRASRGPAREALQRLRRTSLVHAVPRVGYIVAGVSLRDFDDVFRIRLSLEPLATELATDRIRRGHASITRLRELATAVDNVDDAVDRGAFVAELNYDFHLEVATLSGNGRLHRMIGPLLDDMNRVMRVLAYDKEAYEELVDDHPSLVDCMESNEPKAAAELMHRQLDQTYHVLRGFATGTDIDITE